MIPSELIPSEMIPRALITCVFLSVLHLIYVSASNDEVSTRANDFSQTNIARAKHYLDNKEKFDHVIVGSSLTNLLVENMLPAKTVNLSFIGKTAYEGLTFIKSHEHIHQTVFIETNLLFRSIDSQFVKNVVSSGFSIIPQGRQEKPAEYLVTESLEIARHLLDSLRKRDNGIDYVYTPHPIQDKELKRQLLNKALADWEKLPILSDVQQNMSQLAGYVNYLESRGTQVIFFEMPVDPEIADSSSARLNRSQWLNVFGGNFTNTILPPDEAGYTQNDGVHLDSDSARAYTRYFTIEATSLF